MVERTQTGALDTSDIRTANSLLCIQIAFKSLFYRSSRDPGRVQNDRQDHLSLQITEKIGQGGMGEVYRGTDTKLKRDLALKVLPEKLSAMLMPDFLMRIAVQQRLSLPEPAAVFPPSPRPAVRWETLTHRGLIVMVRLEWPSNARIPTASSVRSQDIAGTLS